MPIGSVARLLAEANINYAVIGGVAMNFHGYRHCTNDIDVLTTPEGLNAIHQLLVGHDYQIEGKRNLRDVQNDIVIDVLVREGPIDCVDLASHRIVALTKLIELKLGAGLAARGRIKDLADVQELIKTAPLPREIGASIRPCETSTTSSGTPRRTSGILPPTRPRNPRSA